MFWLQLVLFSILSSCFAKDGDKLVANIDHHGIKGIIRFEQFNATTVEVNVDLEYPGADNKVICIHQHPTNYHDSCLNVGKKIYQFSSGIQKKQQFFVSTNITLRGPNSIQGSSLVISNTNNSKIVCGTILAVGSNNKYAMAGFSNNIFGGKVEFIQQGEGETVIIGQLSRSDGSTVASNNHSMYIITNTTSDMVPKCPVTLDPSTVYNPEKTTGPCDKTNMTTCRVGDLVGKHGPITVGIKGNKRFTIVDSNLPLNGETVMNRLLVITSNNEARKVIGCGIIKLSGPLHAESVFTADQHKGVSGQVQFKQVSPYHKTELKVNFEGLNGRAGGYHVHNFPISDPSNPCGKASVGGHMNPYKVDAKKSPATGKGTMDQYEIGDLSKKYGMLTSKSSYAFSATDNMLPLFGSHTVIGRSIVIHRKDATNSRMVCSNIAPSNSIKLEAHLNYTKQDDLLDGYVSLSQYKLSSGIMTPTIFLVSLGYKGNSSKKTYNHNFHVHTKPVGNDTMYGSKCKSAGGHFNPVSVSMANYKKQCDKDHPYRCEMGDSSAKFGTYDIGAGKRIYADEDTPLYGKYTVFGRSIVFHAESKGSPRIACSDIKPVEGGVVKEYSMEGLKSVKDNDRMNTMKSIVLDKFGWLQKKWKVSYPRLAESDTDSKCYKFSFFVIDGKPSHYSNDIKTLSKTKSLTFHPCKSANTESGAVTAISSMVVTLTSLLLTYVLLL